MINSSLQRERTTPGIIKTAHYPWIVLSVVFGTTLAQSLSGQGIPVLYPFIQSEFGLSHAQVGIITSSYAIGFVGIVAVAGWLTDSLGVKRMITISLLGVTASSVAILLAFSWPMILTLTIFIGIASTPMYPATTLAIME